MQTQQASAITTRAATAMEIPAVNPRAGTIRIYLNITSGNSAIPVEIADVASFRFTEENSIVFTLTNGNTIELADYQGLEFTIEPTQPATNSKWDLEKTLKFGGAAYGVNSSLPYVQWCTSKYVTVYSNEEVICYDLSSGIERKYPIKFIPDYEAGFSMFWFDDYLRPGYSYRETLENGIVAISLSSIDDGVLFGGTAASNFEGGTNVIDTRFSIDKNDNLKVIFRDGEYIFK
jgi:hypothetical protein